MVHYEVGIVRNTGSFTGRGSHIGFGYSHRMQSGAVVLLVFTARWHLIVVPGVPLLSAKAQGNQVSDTISDEFTPELRTTLLEGMGFIMRVPSGIARADAPNAKPVHPICSYAEDVGVLGGGPGILA
ncbi:hypothetical protein B0H17DRAFT_1153637 [Mycena rosella]|uniref:Uncharacterized protein n=1 Tax=Mycena rosella TaxID=1033263 RepID=A0AAD7B4C7_MYCRO|nr:hypothetical protein B0H17DRAFT_1153637 [Mycena rosella]